MPRYAEGTIGNVKKKTMECLIKINIAHASLCQGNPRKRRKKQLSVIASKNGENLRKSPSASANISGYRSKSSPSPPVPSLTPPPNSASSNNGKNSPLLTSEPVLLSVTTV